MMGMAGRWVEVVPEMYKQFERKIVEQVRQEGREFLYHRQHPQYTNTILRRAVWGEIGNAIGMPPAECMKRWKLIRAKYVRILNTPSDVPLKARDAWLAKAMVFLKDQIAPEGGEQNEKSITFPPVARPGPPQTSKVMVLDDGSKVIIQSRPPPTLLPKAIPTNFPVKETKEPVKSVEENSCHENEFEIEVLEDMPLWDSKPTILNSPRKMTQTFERQTVAKESVKAEDEPFDMFGKYVAAELRHLPKRQAIVMQQELQNTLIRTKLSFLEPTDSDATDIFHVNANSPYSTTNSSNDGSKDYDGLSQTMITTFGANDK